MAEDPITGIVCPIRLDYTITPGRAQTRFLRGLENGKLLGQRCPATGKVYMPPRGSSPTHGLPTTEEVEVADRGTVTTFCVVNLQFASPVREIPYVCAQILLDGADIPFFFVVQEVDVNEIRMGMRVEAVWKDPSEWGPTLENILFFKPTGEADAPRESYKEHV